MLFYLYSELPPRSLVVCLSRSITGLALILLAFTSRKCILQVQGCLHKYKPARMHSLCDLNNNNKDKHLVGTRCCLVAELQAGNSHKGLNRGQYMFPNNAAQTRRLIEQRDSRKKISTSFPSLAIFTQFLIHKYLKGRIINNSHTHLSSYQQP